MEGLPVTLIVKAPNQQIEDQKIKCQLTWTIQELKGHLSEVYPLKPKQEEQKLIYSGQLLTDSVVLKDVLRRYEGQDIHTVHLVCAVPQVRQSKTPAMNSETKGTPVPQLNESEATPSGLRHRNVNDSHPNQTTENYWRQQNEQNEPRLYYPQDMQFVQRVQSENNDRNAWRNTGYQVGQNNLGAVPMQMNDPVALAAAQMAWMQHMQAQYMQFYSQAMQTATTVNNPPPVENNQPAPQAPPPEPPAEVDPEPRDWLDWFYTASRACVMFTVIYFYSSPLRFLLVLVTAFLIYLYQIRYFHSLVQNNNVENVNNNNNAPRVDNNNGEQPNVEQPANNTENQPIEEAPVNTNNQAADQMVVQETQPSYLAITWTVITSFLTSLLPDAPNAI